MGFTRREASPPSATIVTVPRASVTSATGSDGESHDHPGASPIVSAASSDVAPGSCSGSVAAGQGVPRSPGTRSSRRSEPSGVVEAGAAAGVVYPYAWISARPRLVVVLLVEVTVKRTLVVLRGAKVG